VSIGQALAAGLVDRLVEEFDNLLMDEEERVA
jgi:hypothetical protein